MQLQNKATKSGFSLPYCSALEATRVNLRVLCDTLKIPRESAAAEISRRYEAGTKTGQRNDELMLTEQLAKDIRSGAWPNKESIRPEANR